MKSIPLTRGYFTTVSDEDFDLVSQFRWYPRIKREGRTVYVQKKRGGSVSLHRFLMQPPPGFEIDHIDGNGLNNQRCNLRLALASENSYNRRMRKTNTSGFKGVSQRGRKWLAAIWKKPKRTRLGLFHSKEDAARAYDQAAIVFFGEFARTNKAMGLLP